MSNRSAFTLIELLIVIAVIAIISVIVVLVLNPAELLRRSRDANRLSDLASLNTALSLYATDNMGTLGLASTSYLSVSDPLASSTAGDQCQGLGFPSATCSSQCAASSSYRGVNGAGWLPVNLKALPAGSPLGTLPVDPVNQTGTRLMYEYTTDGTTFEVTGVLESQKYRNQPGISAFISYPGVVAIGSNLTLSCFYNPTGLAAYWNFDEGAGSSTIDRSGNGNTGAWAGTPQNGSYYTDGKVGAYAGNFYNGGNYVSVPGNSALALSSGTYSAWIRTTFTTAPAFIIDIGSSTIPQNRVNLYVATDGSIFTTLIATGSQCNLHNGPSVADGNWHQVATTWGGTPQRALYVDGQLVATSTCNINFSYPPNPVINIGADTLIDNDKFHGSIDDVRVYNRPLSSAEIQALYDSEE